MNWAKWRLESPDKIIGSKAQATYRGVAQQLSEMKDLVGTESTGSFAFSGDPGVGKTSIAMMLANGWVDDPFNLRHGPEFSGGGIKVATLSTLIDECRYAPLIGKCRALVINEVDKMQRHLQEMLLDWIEDYLPDHFVVFVTTNKNLEAKVVVDKLSKSEREEYLEPRFAERFMPYHITNPTNEEMASSIESLTGVPTQIAQHAARNAQGSVRSALKQVAKWKAAVNSKKEAKLCQ